MQILENSRLPLSEKLILAYLLVVPQKAGALFARAEGVGDEPPDKAQRNVFEQEWSDINKTLTAMHVPYFVDRPLGVEEGIYRYRIIAAKKGPDLEAIRGLVTADETEEAATKLGRLMGYPETAVATYRTADALDVETDLPPQEVARLRAEHVLPFVIFKLSRTHYREELNRVRIWQRLVRTHCPKLYGEIISDYEEFSRQSIDDPRNSG